MDFNLPDKDVTFTEDILLANMKEPLFGPVQDGLEDMGNMSVGSQGASKEDFLVDYTTSEYQDGSKDNPIADLLWKQIQCLQSAGAESTGEGRMVMQALKKQLEYLR